MFLCVHHRKIKDKCKRGARLSKYFGLVAETTGWTSIKFGILNVHTKTCQSNLVWMLNDEQQKITAYTGVSI
jgi:hypothetical protein